MRKRSQWAAVVVGCLALAVTACGDRQAGIVLTDPAAQAVAPVDPTARPVVLARADAPLAENEPGQTGAAHSVVAGDSTSTINVELPPIPPVEMPDVFDIDTTEVVEERLGGFVTDELTGVDVLAADCEAEGGELEYGDTGDDVYKPDGSGRVVEQSDDGLTTLIVEADGSGSFYSESDTALLTIKVAPDRSGEFYHQLPSELTTISFGADGSGEYYTEGPDRLATVSINANGSGQFFRQQDDEVWTIDARADGSGEYFLKRGAAKITVRVESDGSWVFTDENRERRIEVHVLADGTGTYARRSFAPLALTFDATGMATYQGRTLEVVVPVTPVFSAVPSFPRLPGFGALAPPCATVIRFDSQLLFAVGEATIRPGAERTLDQVVAALHALNKPIEVNGHTDSQGSDESNQRLSLDRAAAVVDELVARGLDVPIEVNGFGETQPAAPNELPSGEPDELGRSLNRRVEIVIREE